ncbi:MAG: endolytic transglycosylase MltG [Burkholderiales bacterium]|nr:endolytic transglycosylase MltG [Burkholderiales bacterium]
MSVYKRILLLLMVAALATGGAFYYWAMTPVRLAQPTLDVTIKPYSPLRSVVAQLNEGGVPVNVTLFDVLARLMRASTKLKSGNYEFQAGVSPLGVLSKLTRGDVNQYAVTIIDGWTFKRMRAEIDSNPALRHDTAGLSDAELMDKIGHPGQAPEGMFFPDTYLFPKGTSDIDVYQRAYRLMARRLADAWAARAPGLPYETPYQALIMASLIEKETGKPADRALVSAVFVNRLRKHMLLQTDPSVIYGLGDQYTGRLRKRDLLMDTPYNTYTRPGLPPTPIALPGAASLAAALDPAQSGALYFVARGDGTSVFSNDLQDHNRAVDKYVRGQP